MIQIVNYNVYFLKICFEIYMMLFTNVISINVIESVTNQQMKKIKVRARPMAFNSGCPVESPGEL